MYNLAPYNLTPYNFEPYGVLTDERLWLEPLPFESDTEIDNLLSRLAFADPDCIMLSRGLQSVPDSMSTSYAEPELMFSSAEHECLGAGNIVNLCPEDLSSHAGMAGVENACAMFTDLGDIAGDAELERFAADEDIYLPGEAGGFFYACQFAANRQKPAVYGMRAHGALGRVLVRRTAVLRVTLLPGRMVVIESAAITVARNSANAPRFPVPLRALTPRLRPVFSGGHVVLDRKWQRSI